MGLSIYNAIALSWELRALNGCRWLCAVTFVMIAAVWFAHDRQRAEWIQKHRTLFSGSVLAAIYVAHVLPVIWMGVIQEEERAVHFIMTCIGIAVFIAALLLVWLHFLVSKHR